MEKKEEIKEEKKEEVKEERKIVVPGETIVTGQNYLPGDNTRREGKDIVASKYGLTQSDGRLIRIIPLSGVYIPRRGNVVIGKITDLSFNGWMVSIDCPYQAFLPVSECQGYISKRDLASHYNIGDLIVTGVLEVKSKGVDLTMKDRGLYKVEGGIVIKINSSRVPRVIGKAGSMINMIKNETGCKIVVGQNGIIWIKGESIEDELFVEKTINLIIEKPHVHGLTEKIKEFLEKEKNKK